MIAFVLYMISVAKKPLRVIVGDVVIIEKGSRDGQGGYGEYGGYAVIQDMDRGGAGSLRERHPHSRWGHNTFKYEDTNIQSKHKIKKIIQFISILI